MENLKRRALDTMWMSEAEESPMVKEGEKRRVLNGELWRERS